MRYYWERNDISVHYYWERNTLLHMTEYITTYDRIHYYILQTHILPSDSYYRLFFFFYIFPSDDVHVLLVSNVTLEEVSIY